MGLGVWGSAGVIVGGEEDLRAGGGRCRSQGRGLGSLGQRVGQLLASPWDSPGVSGAAWAACQLIPGAAEAA